MKVLNVIPDSQVKSMTLELDGEEARVLYDILQFVGGDPSTSRRGVSDRILKGIRIHFGSGNRDDDIVRESTGITFLTRR